jgi:hypothetical protein
MFTNQADNKKYLFALFLTVVTSTNPLVWLMHDEWKKS